MRYTLGRVPSVSASSRQRVFASNNGSTFSGASNNEIIIPVSAADGFLQASKGYLAFGIDAVTLTQNGTLSLDAVGAMISSVRIESQGVLLERLERYNVRHNFRIQHQTNLESQGYRSSMIGGTDPAAVVPIVGRAVTAADNHTFQCAVELESGFLNGHDGTAIPMGCDFNLIIRLAPVAEQAIFAAGEVAGLNVTNPRFISPMYKIENPAALQAYKQFRDQSGVSWSGNSWKTYIGNSTAGAAETVMQINDRSLSLLNFVTVQRLLTAIVLTGSKVTFLPNGCTQFVYEINGENYPSAPIAFDGALVTLNTGRAYKELKNADMAGAPIDSFLVSAFAMAVDLKVFDDHALALRGINTAQSASPNILRFSGATAAAEQVTFAHCEAYWTLRPDGQLSVVI
jgi:hypothetical protein